MEILNRKIFLPGLAAIMLAVLLGCTKEADIKLPPQENKLVVTSFISPNDTNILVTVRNSTPKFNWSGMWGPQYSNLPDATVLLSDGSMQVRIPFDSTNGFYLAHASILPIVEGKTYYLEVSYPDGRKVSASTTVPRGIPSLQSFDIDLLSQNNNNLSYNSRISVGDLPGTTYIYAIFDLIGSILPDDPPTVPETYSQPGYVSMSDEYEKRVSFELSYQAEYYDSGYAQYLGSSATILHADKHFYFYHKTIREAPNSYDNPFGDPVMVYSNINNGLGCFGSYTMSRHLKRIR